LEALAVTRPPALGITGEAVGTSRLITAKKCSHDRAKNHPGKKIVFGSLKSARAPVFAGLRRVRWCSKAPYQSTVILGKGRKAISICWLPKHPANVLVTKLVANSGPRVGIEWDGSARAADFRNTNQHFEGQNETGRNGRQQISSAARSTTLPPLRGRKGQQARSVGRYVSNAAGRNKGGAPIEIDELIGEWRRPAA
jgi:hypothetical protein